MTNTHINVGGHKITTNKVGVKHNITLPTGISASSLWWRIVNGICYINIWGLQSTTTGTQTIASGLPIPFGGVYAGNTLCSGSSPMAFPYVKSDGVFVCDFFQANISSFGSLVYTVADDWVES